MIMLDANMVLRYFLDDVPSQSDYATRLIEEGTPFVPTEVLMEVCFASDKVYHLTRNAVSDMVSDFISLPQVYTADKDALLFAFDAYKRYKLDIVDCVLLAYHKVNGDTVETFDKKLLRHLNKH